MLFYHSASSAGSLVGVVRPPECFRRTAGVVKGYTPRRLPYNSVWSCGRTTASAMAGSYPQSIP